ncbi:MAG TPA: MaoC family dehydratase [Candidatus Eisenbacteria bacterium]|nr:MaoC family dehydratase [Candidatus Eisenbacteria bacterium]
MQESWPGRFFEDFKVGEVYRHQLGRTLTEVDNTWFTLLTCNTNQIHFNADYAARSEFRRPLMNSCLTLSLVTGLSVPDISQNVVANLGWDKVTLPAPVFAGDTIYAESEVLETRASKSRPGQGIVRVRTRGYKQDGTVVIEFERTVLVHSRQTTPKQQRPSPRSGPSGAGGKPDP